MEMEYDIASLSEIPSIVELKIAMFREFDYEQYLDKNARELISDDYARMYEANLAMHFLAKEGDQIVGMVGAFIKSDIPFRYFSNSQYGFIGDVYTNPGYRSAGISMKLNKQALDWLQEYGVDFVRLLASDAGRSIYEQLGFSADADMVLRFKS